MTKLCQDARALPWDLPDHFRQQKMDRKGPSTDSWSYKEGTYTLNIIKLDLNSANKRIHGSVRDPVRDVDGGCWWSDLLLEAPPLIERHLEKCFATIASSEGCPSLKHLWEMRGRVGLGALAPKTWPPMVTTQWAAKLLRLCSSGRTSQKKSLGGRCGCPMTEGLCVF